MIFLYYLIDPRTSEVRYVGYTKNPKRRFSAHIHQLLRPCHKVNWIRLLQAEGFLPVMKIVTSVDHVEKAKLLEVMLIQLLRDAGADLVNGTDGGDGTSGNQNFSEDARRRMGEKSRLPKSEETKQRMREAHANRSPEASALRGLRISLGQLGHEVPQERRDKISRSLQGSVIPPDVREKISASVRAYWTPERCREHGEKVAAGRAARRT